MRRILAMVAVMALMQLAASGCRHVGGACDCEHAGPQDRSTSGSCGKAGSADAPGSLTAGAAAAPNAAPTAIGPYAPK